MNKIVLVTVILIIFLTFLSVRGNEGDSLNEDNPANATLIVLGQSGHGISTTVKRLLGSRKPTPNVNGSYKGVLVEVSEVPLSTGGFFKIVDVEGVLEGKTIVHDAQVLSTLKSYLQDPEQGKSTNFFIAISKFDDYRLHGLKSMFVQTLRRVQMLQEEVYGNTTNTALLLTRLMSEMRTVQRKPERRIAEFRSAIRDFTSFDINSTEIIVGENLPEEYNLKVENGQTRLPNKQYYPQNVFDSLIKIASNLNDSKSVEALEEFMEGRNRPEEIIKRPYPLTKPLIPYLDNSLFIKLHLTASEIHTTELSNKLSDAFSIFNSAIKPQAILSLITLLLYFKKNNLITLEDLSNKTVDTEIFFQTVPSNTFQLALLSEAFNLTKPIVPCSRCGIWNGIENSEPEINLIKGLSDFFVAFNNLTDTDRDSFFKLYDYFLRSNLTTSYDLPMTTLDKVKFFQSVLLDEFQLKVLYTAFRFSMPKFAQHPVVGYGFDVRKDKFLLKTPFVADKFKASSIGYRLPNFVSCSTIEPLEEVVYSICNENFDEYVATRMHFLGLHKDTTKSFQGKLRPGLIFERNETSVLSVVREFRTLKCELHPEAIHLNEQFKSTINNLGSFNSSDRDSVKKWVEFFENYGTHIVSIGYGGGSIEGRLEATSSQNLFDNLNSIVQFGNFSTQEMPNYTFFGGFWDKQINLHSLEQHERKNVLVSWKNSVKDDPIMFDFELSLIPISTYAKFANITLGEEIDKCVELYLAGRLAFLDPENTVGQGFNLLNESCLVSTPFVKNNLKASSIGYLLPDFINCSIIEPPTKRDIAYYNEDFAEYAPTRLRLLGFERDETPTKFEGNIRMGFNIRPSESDTLLSLSTVREVRVIKCELVYNNETELNEEFKSVLNSLGPFEESDRDSVTEWIAFFEKYGTHIVSLGYGGGRIEGVFEGQSLKEIFKSKAKIQETLGKIVSFGRLQSEEVPIYTFFGGAGENQLENISSLEQHVRDGMLEKWISSLKKDPIMLKYELGLTPISTFAKLVNITVGEEVENNLPMYLSGNLKYIRMKKLTCPFKPEDYKENIVGQGYNLLTGVVLPTSPFELGKLTTRKLEPPACTFCRKNKAWKNFAGNSLSMRDRVKLNNIQEPYIKDIDASFTSKNEYIFHRIKSTSGDFFHVKEVPVGFKDEIPNWVNIENPVSPKNTRQRNESELRFAKLTLETPKFSGEFLDALYALPFMSTYYCNTKMQWMQFFETYGTHYVKSAFVGQAENSHRSDPSYSPSLSETKSGNVKKVHGLYLNVTEGIHVLKSSLVLERLALLLWDHPQLQEDVDAAYYQLLKNNLECLSTDKDNLYY